MRAAILSLLILPAAAAAAEPPTAGEAVRLALADARKLGGVTAGRTRYVSAHNTPAARLRGMETVLRGLLPSLSRGTGRTGLRAVATVAVKGQKPAAWLWAFDAADYGTHLPAFAALRFSDPYFHAPTGDVTKEPAVPEHLPAPEFRELSALVQSAAAAPITRADYLVYRTSQQEGRTADGYYDWLQLRSVGDVDQLAGLDERRAVALDADRQAILLRSGPGLHNRRVARFDAATGPAWKTFDAVSDTSARNVAVQLDRSQADGGMGVYVLPNRLPFTWLYAVQKGKEVLVDVAPPNVAGHRESVSNDLQIHPNQCQHCHLRGGLSPLRNDALALFRKGNPFADRDDARARRVKAVMLNDDLVELMEGDRDRADKAMTEAAGVDYRTWGRAHRDELAEYLADVTPPKLAAETGFSAPQIRRALARFEAREGAGRLNPVVALFKADNPGTGVRRELVEEAFPTLMNVVRQESKP